MLSGYTGPDWVTKEKVVVGLVWVAIGWLQVVSSLRLDD